MDNYNNTCENQTDDLITVLSIELNKINSENELILKKSSELYAEIAACEEKQEYMSTTLAEAQKIAQEITSISEQRVEKIIARVQNEVESQLEQIAVIEQEIAELSHKTNPSYIKENKPEPPIKDISTKQNFSQFELEDENAENMPEMIKVVPTEANMPLDESEYSLGDSQKQDNSKDQPEIAERDESEADEMQGGEDIFQELRNLRETITARQQDKPELSFKERLEHLFKTKN